MGAAAIGKVIGLGVPALVLAGGIGAAWPAGLSDMMKKYNAPQGKEQAPPQEAPPPAEGEEFVIVENGDWTLRYDYFWDSIEGERTPVCAAYTFASDPTGATEDSVVFYTRWSSDPDLAEFSVAWGPTVGEGSPASLVVQDSHSEALDLTQGYAFLQEGGDDAVASRFQRNASAELRFSVSDGSRQQATVQRFSLNGFGTVYAALFSQCEPVEQFRR